MVVKFWMPCFYGFSRVVKLLCLHDAASHMCAFSLPKEYSAQASGIISETHYSYITLPLRIKLRQKSVFWRQGMWVSFKIWKFLNYKHLVSCHTPCNLIRFHLVWFCFQLEYGLLMSTCLHCFLLVLFNACFGFVYYVTRQVYFILHLSIF